MPKPRYAQPEDLARAKAAVARHRSPTGQPDKVEMSVKLVLHRGVAEQVTLRAIREGKNVEPILEELIEAGLKRSRS